MPSKTPQVSPEERKIRFKDLSWLLRFAALGGLASFIIYVSSFLIGFLRGFFGAL